VRVSRNTVYSLIRRLTLALFCIFLVQVAFAAEQDCTNQPDPMPSSWRAVTSGVECSINVSSTGGSGQYFSSIGAIQAGILAKTSPWNAELSGTRSISTVTYCGRTGTAGSYVDHYDQRWLIGASPRHQPFKIQQSGGTETCAPVVDCASMANQKILAQAADVADSYVPGDTPCLSGCAAFKLNTQPYHRLGASGHRDYLIRYQMTGLTCTTEVAPSVTTTTTTNQSSSATDKFSTTPTSEPGCGFVNGKYVCMPPTGKCWVNSDGSRLCADNAPTPPVPRNSSNDGPAAPNSTVQSCTGSNSCSTNNYYNTTTVNGSPTPVSGGGDPNNQGGAGTAGTGPGSVPGGTDSGTCVGSDCSLSDGVSGDFAGPTMDEASTFGESTLAFWDALEASPLIGAWTGIGSSIPAGSCPAANITVFGETYSLTEFMCQIWEDEVAALLALVFLFVWPFMGLRIIMSA